MCREIDKDREKVRKGRERERKACSEIDKDREKVDKGRERERKVRKVIRCFKKSKCQNTIMAGLNNRKIHSLPLNLVSRGGGGEGDHLFLSMTQAIPPPP